MYLTVVFVSVVVSTKQTSPWFLPIRCTCVIGQEIFTVARVERGAAFLMAPQWYHRGLASWSFLWSSCPSSMFEKVSFCAWRSCETRISVLGRRELRGSILEEVEQVEYTFIQNRFHPLTLSSTDTFIH